MLCVKCKSENIKKKATKGKLCQKHYEDAKSLKRAIVIPLRDYYYSLIGRCSKPEWKLYATYGAKGYTVNEAWHKRDDFVSWGRSQGYRKGMILKLKEGCKEYGPDTCYFEKRG